jgi:hypothetical protein
MTGINIDDDVVRHVAVRYDGLAVRAVSIHGVDATGAQLKHKRRGTTALSPALRVCILTASDMWHLHGDLARTW